MSKKRKIIASSKIVKKKKVHVDSIKFNSTKLIHLEKIVTRVVSLHFMYIIACSTINVIIADIKIKTIFNNKIKVNCIFKRLINAAQLFMRQKINIIIIIVIDKRARFFNICEAILINIENVIVSIFIFIIKRSNHKFFLERLF